MVYCICKKPYSSSDEISIECDGTCKSWYHPSCINATKIEVGLIESDVPIIWMCPPCTVHSPHAEKDLRHEVQKHSRDFGRIN